MHSFADLFDLSYKKERVAARRLVRIAGLSEETALRTVLETAAGDRPLADLLATRRQLLTRAAEKIAARRQTQQAARNRKNMPPTPADAWLAWFDGSSHPNPGRMGIGGLLQSPDGRSIAEISRAAGHGDSSEAEYLALNAVLEAAVAAQPARLVIHGDSQVVIDDICSKRRPAASLTEQRERALRSISQLANVVFVWIPRHKNARADALSQRAVRHMSAYSEPGS
jgi:ribonuclease HI